MRIPGLTILLLLAGTAVTGQETPVTIALVGVEVEVPSQPGLAEGVVAKLSEALGGAKGVELVERQRIDAILKEQKVQASGLVRAETAQQTGRLLGARLLVHCKLYQVGEELWASARVMDAETAKAQVVLAKAPIAGPTGKLLDDLAARILVCAQKQAARMANGKAPPPDGRQRKEWKGTERPLVAIALTEDAKWDARAVASIRNVLSMQLNREGFTVRVFLSEPEVEWVRQCLKEPAAGPAASDLTHILVARIKTEVQGRQGEQIRTAVHLELQAIERKSGKPIAACKAGGAATEISETFSVLSALEQAGKEAARLLSAQMSTKP